MATSAISGAVLRIKGILPPFPSRSNKKSRQISPRAVLGWQIESDLVCKIAGGSGRSKSLETS
jgi:hypothetical protein